MLEVGWTEILVIAIVLIIVVGPKDLPQMLRTFGRMVTKLRGMAGEFRQQFDEALREADLDDVRKTISDAQSLNPMNAIRDAVNPLRQMGDDIKSDLKKATSISQVEATAASSVSSEPSAEALSTSTEGVPSASAVGAAASAAVASPVTAAPVQPVQSAPIAQATNPVEATARAIDQAAKAKKPATTVKEPEPKPVARKPSTAKAKAPMKTAGAAKTADKVAKPTTKAAGEAAKKTTTRKPKKDEA
ncbi:twin-arginine translocase subunit TatB [Rhizobium sp. ARZ01]|uniref:Sec-independent protein translocase protein TatB n=1 Tax=Rhizobium sp. ARZ01 TaxID=2769313 RepID=UPI00177A937E|nr:Sec-independent protein translocase protein TatB [Rhizobium sp. ARZ01]MBD9372156.1 twin-arginine translocase subunit TatB [Rhizobium sp. ARZ01]